MHKMIGIMLVLLMLSLTIADVYAQSGNGKKDDSSGSSSSSNANLLMDISTVPSRLVKGEEGFLAIQVYNNEPTPFIAEIASITSSNPDILSIDKGSIQRVGNTLLIKVMPLESGIATVTLTTRDLNLKPVSKEIRVYEPLDRPSKLGLTVKPSSFSYLGPYDGYIAVQLLNVVDEPVVADKDYDIHLSSSNPFIINLNTTVRISKGENYAYIHFTLNAKSSGSTTILARYNDMVASESITFDGIYGKVLRLYAVDMVPALKGQFIYAFVQLQDSNGKVIYADKDMSVEVRADTHDIIGGTGVIRKGESTAAVRLMVNTDKPCPTQDACVSLIALSKDMASDPVKINLMEPIIANYTSGPKSIDSSLKIYARIVPKMPIVADGKEKVIGALQLISYPDNAKNDAQARPIIADIDTQVNIISSSKVTMKDAKVTVPKGSNMQLLDASIGYSASKVKVTALADYLENSIMELDVQGYSDVSIAAEPLVSKISYAMPFPYIVYFKDSIGKAAYPVDDMSVRVNGDGIAVKQGDSSVRKGGSSIILELESLRKGSINAYVEAIGMDTRYEANSIIDTLYLDRSNFRLDAIMPDKVLLGSKHVAAVELLYKDYPIMASDDVRLILFSNGISIPADVSIARGRHYAFFTVEARSADKASVTVMADGFNSVSKEVEVVNDTLSIRLDAPNKVNTMDIFDVSLAVSYAGMPLSNMQVRWSADAAVLTSMYDSITDSKGSARAKFLAYDEGVITVSAIVNGYGIERSTSIMVESGSNASDVNTDADNAGNDASSYDSMSGDSISISMSDDSMSNNDNILDQLNSVSSNLPIDAEFLIMLPAVGGIAAWFVNKRLRAK